MDLFQFFADLARSLGWPGTVVALAYLFRRDVAALLQRIEKGRLGAVEVGLTPFGAAVNAVAATLPERVGQLQDDRPVEGVSPSGGLDQAIKDPRGAVIESWFEVETAMLVLADARGILIELPTRGLLSRPDTEDVQRLLITSGTLPLNAMMAIADLHQLRNRAAHDPKFKPGPTEVVTYAEISRNMARELRRLALDPDATYALADE